MNVRKAGPLTFSAQGRFRIVQFTDTHFNEGEPDAGKAEAVLALMGQVLDAERPDLVVLTGDIVPPRRSMRVWIGCRPRWWSVGFRGPP
jgi:predicted MPP superfamily phosphohydrolase